MTDPEVEAVAEVGAVAEAEAGTEAEAPVLVATESGKA